MTIARVISSLSFALLCGVCSAVLDGRPAAAQAPYPSCGGDPTYPNITFIEVHNSTFARWCVDETIWSANEPTVTPFFKYYDIVVPTLATQFQVQMPQITIEVLSSFNGAAATTVFGNKPGVRLGVSSFSESYTNPMTPQGGIPGFFGYIYPLHESVNVMTSQVSPGWPEDWWTDEYFNPPFPNAMDIAVLHYIATSNNQTNQTLLDVYATQQWRFHNPESRNYDHVVIMFDNFQTTYGFEGFAQMFQLAYGDQLKWPQVSQDSNYTADNNWSALLSEYVIAYLSLGFGTTTDLTQTFVQAGVGTHKGHGVQPYTVDPAAVKAIGDAHCLIRSAKAAGVNVSAQLAALQAGNFSQANVAGGTSATCPNECTWLQQYDIQGPGPSRLVFERCVAKWDNCPDGVWDFQKQACGPFGSVSGSAGGYCETTGGTCSNQQAPPKKRPQ